jgi:hypothetical protein
LLSGCEGGQESTQVDPGPKFSEQASLAIVDLSGRLGVPSGEIEVVKESSVTWRDGSMGCPKEGMMYTQALVEGTLIVLRVDGKNYAYHSGKGRPPFYCDNPEKPAPKPSLD